jgi:hypothetical protein
MIYDFGINHFEAATKWLNINKIKLFQSFGLNGVNN